MACRRNLLLLLLPLGLAHADPSLWTGIPWEQLSRHTVVPRPLRPGWVERAIREGRDRPLSQLLGQECPDCPLRLEVFKAQFAMVAFRGTAPLKVYPVSLSGAPVGTKLQMGDRKTPEGRYRAFRHVSPTYGASLLLGYPNWVDAFRGFLMGFITYAQFRQIERALELGLPPPQNTPLGAQILIHTSRTRADSCATCQNWSMGCIVLERRDLEEILAQVPWWSSVEVIVHPVDTPMDSSLAASLPWRQWGP